MTKEAYSVAQFCDAFNITKPTFYRLLKTDNAPLTFRIGRRLLISKESVDKWRRRMEASTNG